MSVLITDTQRHGLSRWFSASDGGGVGGVWGTTGGAPAAPHVHGLTFSAKGSPDTRPLSSGIQNLAGL